MFYSCLNSEPACCSIHSQSLWRSCFSQAFVVCMCVPAHSDPPHGWLVGIPASLCNYGSSPSLSALLSLHRHILKRVGPASHFPPGQLAQALILTITHHQEKMYTDNRSRQQLHAVGKISVSITLGVMYHESGLIIMFFNLQ